MPFSIDSDPTTSEISDALNYLLSNFSIGNTVDPVTGQIVAPGGGIVGYIYQYLAVKYADDQFGTGFSNSPTGKNYYGVNNSNNAAESSNPADYIWYQATGGFGSTKYLWYITTGGRQIQFAVSPTAPDTAWLVDPGSSIDLDNITSGTTPVIAESFVPYFTPGTLQVPRSGSPLAPVFTGVVARMYATNAGIVVPFTDAQTDSNVAFVNNSWRIGNSSTTGNGDISYTNITVGAPTDAGDYALFPAPTAMSANPAYITVPVRYKNSTGVVSQAGVATIEYVFADPGANGSNGPQIDFSGFTGFSVNNAGVYSPSTATLTAIATNVTSPTYSWSITNATPTFSTTSSVVITPNSSVTSVQVSLTVNGTNLTSPVTVTKTLPVTFDGAPGTAGANGVQSAFPSIYIWTGSSSVPTRPSTTSTYTWATGSYSAPSGWSTTAPTNTTPGNYLWQITIPLTVSATVTTSTLDWTDTSYAIRAIAYNGANGATGATGSAGSATFLVTRTANDSSAPTNSEVNAAIGRNPVAGDIVTVSYNSGNNAVVYRYTTTWVTQSTYLTGDLIVNGTVTANKFASGIVWTNQLVVGSSPAISGTTMTGTGANIYASGNFAFGNSTTNMVFDGTNIYLNGFSNATTTSLTQGKLISGGTDFFSILLTFNPSKQNNIIATANTIISANRGGAVAADTDLEMYLYIYIKEILPATSIVAGSKYAIITEGTTNFAALGAVIPPPPPFGPSQAPGVIFTSTGTGSGTGTVINLTSGSAIAYAGSIRDARRSGYNATYSNLSYTAVANLPRTSLGYCFGLLNYNTTYVSNTGGILGFPSAATMLVDAKSSAYEANI